MSADAAFKFYIGICRLLKVNPKQPLADDAKKLAYKTNQGRTSTTKGENFKVLQIITVTKVITYVTNLKQV